MSPLYADTLTKFLALPIEKHCKSVDERCQAAPIGLHIGLHNEGANRPRKRAGLYPKDHIHFESVSRNTISVDGKFFPS